jgi:hypothetical protein
MRFGQATGASILILIALFTAPCLGQPIEFSPISPPSLYGRSAALLIGVSKYQFKSWDTLSHIPIELDDISRSLKRQGFEVVSVPNPNGLQLYEQFRTFFAKYRKPTDRLLIWFSGHGWTDETGLGYIVPADAPDPRIDRTGFFEKAISMTEMVALARDIYANHALFIFDSCFSGSVFMTRSTIELPTQLFLEDVQHPVRQFITAGNELQKVPAVSDLVPAFITAIEGAADINGDGLVTGSEIGAWLKNTIIALGKQTPQYGTINDPRLSRGDIVFFPQRKTAINQVAEKSFDLRATGQLLAKVDGAEIRQSDLALAEEELGPSLAQMDPATKKENVLAFLIDMKIVAKAAEDKKVENNEDFKKRLAFTRNRLLMDSLLATEGKAATTDEAMKISPNSPRRNPRIPAPPTAAISDSSPRIRWCRNSPPSPLRWSPARFPIR